MSLDELDRVARERLIGSPPHSFQHLGTLEKVNYIGTVGRISKMGTIAYIGTVLLVVHIGTLNKVNRIGTLDEMTRAGTLNRIAGGRVGTMGRLGTVHYQERLGTVEHVGSVNYLGTVNRVAGGRLGSIGTLSRISYINRVGTIHELIDVTSVVTVQTVDYIRRTGTIGRIGTAHTGTVPTDSQTRLYNPRVFLTGSRIGQGSTWVGSWSVIDIYRVKTPAFKLSRGGSVILVVGMVGTRQADVTGTYYGPVRIGKGSFNTFSFTEAMQYARPIVVGGGTARVVFGRQV